MLAWRHRRRLAVTTAVAWAALASPPAEAYVREVTQEGTPIFWKNPCVDLHVYLGAPPPVLDADGYLEAALASAAAWSYPRVRGTDLRFNVVAESNATADVGYDQQSVVVFRTGSWCREPAPVDDSGNPLPECYPSTALAVTSLFKNRHTGEILDADIEFNGVDFSWGDWVGRPGLATPTTADFQNALTHELGHVAGLDHNCFAPSDGQPRLPDHTGALEIDCYGNPSLPAAVADATMYPSVVLSDVVRRTLSDDDILGISDVYPHAHESCPAVAQGGCAVTARAQGTRTSAWLTGGGMVLAVSLAGWLARRRRRHA